MEQRLFLAIAISMLVLIGYYIIFPPAPPPKPDAGPPKLDAKWPTADMPKKVDGKTPGVDGKPAKQDGNKSAPDKPKAKQDKKQPRRLDGGTALAAESGCSCATGGDPALPALGLMLLLGMLLVRRRQG